MPARPPKLPPPTMFERADAADAARALRAAVDGSAPWGEHSVMFLSLSRPRRGECHETWAGLPHLSRVNGRFRHELLPGWTYTRAELAAEMIPDLVALAERGERPTEAASTVEVQ